MNQGERMRAKERKGPFYPQLLQSIARTRGRTVEEEGEDARRLFSSTAAMNRLLCNSFY
jgi:hypothetical protein